MKIINRAYKMLSKRYSVYTSANFHTKYYSNAPYPTKDKDLVVIMTKKISELSLKGEIDCAKKLFDELPHRDCVTWNVMIKGYIENHRLRDAHYLFDKMLERNSVSWNSMIMGYIQERYIHMALKLFLIMPDKDVTSWTSMISGLCRNSRILDAWRLFKEMPEPNSVTWSSIISGFQQNGLATETLILFKEMLLVGIQPTSHSFTSVLSASADLASSSIGQELYCQCIKRGFENNTRIGNSAISMFVKSGNFVDARRIFVSICQPDIITWNSMIVGYGQNGFGFESIMVFHQMQKARLKPDKVSFLGVIQGCSHCGLVKEAIQYFTSMNVDHGISPGLEHYACMVDVLSRAGWLREAWRMIIKMPFEPVAIFWRTLLNGCKIWKDVQLGVYAADRVLELEPHNSSACLMVLEMYKSVGRSGEVVEMRRRMNKKEGNKELAYSWIEIKGRTHLFSTRDETHVESDDIYNTLKLLYYEFV